MKKPILLAAVLLSGCILQTAKAQVFTGFRVNITKQPVWGPVGYDHVEYYYMPDIDVYYYVPDHQYIYLQSGRWIFSASLPSRFQYDINTGYKVVINEPTPYYHAETYRRRYASYRGNHSQEIIRNSRDSRYYANKGHPEYNSWKNDQKPRNNGRNNNERGNKDHMMDN